ncbi:GNAT family N-acetyltransferase [Cytobacillus sp. NCCP-133]|uniref:GNAT family N-acetyltransferase n=1 Tax=Cytobacillus sp. NCCP-133 TaxID=766848 RepID=UPI00222F20C3|nr:GNAT family N-acetyltransferase [Cytobacillus sp. NCCP-133]GLB61670.1 N-acetyltransferase [Cytobacillus sp. NCCP-133]
MNTAKVRIGAVTADNWYDCCLLELAEDQKVYMEPNAVSIAQSKFETTLKPYAIYLGDKAVGFLMYNTVQEELDGYWIYRIMVDKKYQGKGIGKKATELMIARMAKLPEAKNIVIGYSPENLEAHNLYASLGFKDHGDRFGKEMAVVKKIG